MDGNKVTKCGCTQPTHFAYTWEYVNCKDCLDKKPGNIYDKKFGRPQDVVETPTKTSYIRNVKDKYGHDVNVEKMVCQLREWFED